MEHEYKYCDVCGMYLDEFKYFKTNNLKKYPSGRLDTCKKCLSMKINNWNPDTFLPILEDIDVPYIKEEWDSLLKRACERTSSYITGMSVICRYLAKMRLRGWRNYRWKDSPHLQEKETKL